MKTKATWSRVLGPLKHGRVSNYLLKKALLIVIQGYKYLQQHQILTCKRAPAISDHFCLTRDANLHLYDWLPLYETILGLDTCNLPCKVVITPIPDMLASYRYIEQPDSCALHCWISFPKWTQEPYESIYLDLILISCILFYLKCSKIHCGYIGGFCLYYPSTSCPTSQPNAFEQSIGFAWNPMILRIWHCKWHVPTLAINVL